MNTKTKETFGVVGMGKAGRKIMELEVDEEKDQGVREGTDLDFDW